MYARYVHTMKPSCEGDYALAVLGALDVPHRSLVNVTAHVFPLGPLLHYTVSHRRNVLRKTVGDSSYSCTLSG